MSNQTGPAAWRDAAGRKRAADQAATSAAAATVAERQALDDMADTIAQDMEAEIAAAIQEGTISLEHFIESPDSEAARQLIAASGTRGVLLSYDESQVGYVTFTYFGSLGLCEERVANDATRYGAPDIRAVSSYHGAQAFCEHPPREGLSTDDLRDLGGWVRRELDQMAASF